MIPHEAAFHFPIPGSAGRDRGFAGGNRMQRPQDHPRGRGRLPRRVGESQADEAGQRAYRICL